MGELMGENVLFPDSPAGFAAFYQSLYNRALPRHALREWVIPLYAARARKKGLIVFAFRGSSKTTTLSIAFTAFRIGHRPSASNLIIQASDPAAADTAAQVADLIANHPAWKVAFPHIVPDPKVGWGSGGFEVRDTNLEYETWRALCAQEKGKDPSLIGLGYKSRALIGKHPTGLLVIDDIHDETNTRSARELRTVTTILTGTILPTVTPQTWQLFVGTPWRENDALAYLSATGRHRTVRTPLTRNNRSVWPARFPRKEIELLRQQSGEAEFARMYLLDLKAAEGIHLRREWLNPYPHNKIQPHWPTILGVDYASTADKMKNDRRDYFAVAIGRALPGGGIVLEDGLRAKLSQGEAEQELTRFIANYPYTVIVGVESVGKGEEFLQMMRRNHSLPWQDMNPGGRSKGDRFEKFMGVEFQNKRVWISDVETPFLRAFHEEWLQWPYADHDDTLDSVAWMLEAGQQYLLSQPRKDNASNPYLSLGRR
jgi:phage terminase large subunit-like protein